MVEWIITEGLTDYTRAVAFMETRAEAIARGEQLEFLAAWFGVGAGVVAKIIA